jgi:hypothetical protein
VVKGKSVAMSAIAERSQINNLNKRRTDTYLDTSLKK